VSQATALVQGHRHIQFDGDVEVAAWLVLTANATPEEPHALHKTLAPSPLSNDGSQIGE
jgi:hypothetical protein